MKTLKEGGKKEKELHLGQALSETRPASWKNKMFQTFLIQACPDRWKSPRTLFSTESW